MSLSQSNITAKDNLKGIIAANDEQTYPRNSLSEIHAFNLRFLGHLSEAQFCIEEKHEYIVELPPDKQHEIKSLLADAMQNPLNLSATNSGDTDPGYSGETLPNSQAPIRENPTEENPIGATSTGENPTVTAFTSESPIGDTDTDETDFHETDFHETDSRGTDTDNTDADGLENGHAETDANNDEEGLTTNSPHIQAERETFLHGETESEATEPFPDYYESCEGDAPLVDEAHEQAYIYAVSKLAEETIRFGEIASSDPSMTPFAARAASPGNISTQPEQASTMDSFYPRSLPSRFPGDQGPQNNVMPPFAMQNFAPTYPCSNQPVQQGAVYMNAPIPQTGPAVVVQPGEVVPAAAIPAVSNEAIQRRRVAGEERKSAAIEEMRFLLSHEGIRVDLRKRFMDMSNMVLRMDWLLFGNLNAPDSVFLAAEVITEVQSIAAPLVHYLSFLDERLQVEVRDAELVKTSLANVARDQNMTPEVRFRNLTRIIIRHLRRPRPIEQRLLSVFLDFYDSHVYTDFLNIYNYQALHDDALFVERMELSRLLIAMWDVLNRTIENYNLVILINFDIKSQSVGPALAELDNPDQIWQEEHEIYQSEVMAREESIRQMELGAQLQAGGNGA
ncbi:hypothetical protein EYZ11_012616 [Aspergillus tanneri]|uniref:Uncharacterized protein n=1 Tax=Aspergillus tanneri TaxID=1220188 RepID=A0A4S3J564_9EURO|nr:uncharacterized protein ATNIH1004_005578 [Aspergillus tanneri]KAA8646903.1 hypothetical protein ATNIH1004_005578 [Aspergillus tanneri]THC87941.1 hypothetical protein EYZ11_012616 [Aspergillus tanneri]